MAEAYQQGVFLMFEGHMTKKQKRPHTKSQGIPETLNQFFAKLNQFSANSVHFANFESN